MWRFVFTWYGTQTNDGESGACERAMARVEHVAIVTWLDRIKVEHANPNDDTIKDITQVTTLDWIIVIMWILKRVDNATKEGQV